MDEATTSVYWIIERDLVSIRALLLVKSEQFFVNAVEHVVCQWKRGETGFKWKRAKNVPARLADPLQTQTLSTCTCRK